MSEGDVPFMSPFSYISIGTLGRTIYVMFSSAVEARDWVDLIIGLVAMRNSNDVPSPVDCPSDTSVQTFHLTTLPTNFYLKAPCGTASKDEF